MGNHLHVVQFMSLMLQKRLTTMEFHSKKLVFLPQKELSPTPLHLGRGELSCIEGY